VERTRATGTKPRQQTDVHVEGTRLFSLLKLIRTWSALSWSAAASPVRAGPPTPVVQSTETLH